MPAEIIAHRGASRERPENTLEAFARALELGADAIELDVHATDDDVLVVHHDPVIPGDDRPISLRSLAALRRRDTGGSTVPPTLGDVLRLVDRRARLYVEAKGVGIAHLLADRLRDEHDWCAVHAFDHRVARDVRLFVPDLATGILTSSYLLDPVGALRAAGARDYWQQQELVDAALVHTVHAAGGRVICWTVNDPRRARELAALGVDGICTDVPDLVREALAT